VLWLIGLSLSLSLIEGVGHTHLFLLNEILSRETFEKRSVLFHFIF
jgi:hypothetical protein